MRFLWMAVCFSVSLFTGSSAPAAEAKPNVILVMCDDLGWGDVSFNGSNIAKTPHLDEMAGHSLKFNRFYAAAPVCSPTRGSVLTGRHPYRYEIFSANKGHMKSEELTLAEALKTKGYLAGHFGKWHLGTLTTKIKDANRGGPGKTQHYTTPAMNGFDAYFSTESKVPTWNPMQKPKTFGPGESLRFGWIPVENPPDAEAYGTYYWDGEERRVTENLEGDDSRIIMDRALPFIETAAKNQQPFFAVIWFHTPHLPVVAGKKHRDLYADRPLKQQLYFGSITAMDEQIGRLRKALREWNIAEDTMLWFCSDNGPESNTPGSAGKFRGRKRSLYEGGVRVPGLLEWPKQIPEGRQTDVPCVTSDYLPTILSITRLEEHRHPEPIDGVNLMPLIEGKINSRERPIAFQSANMAALSDNRYKLVMAGQGNQAKAELYDLDADPGEEANIAADHPEITHRMRQTLKEWQASCRRSAEGSDYEPNESKNKLGRK
jgi:arylsulfatase A-like enzyme